MAFAGGAAAQELQIPPVVYPGLPAEAASAEGFAPAGWAVERQAAGDLDGDGVADLAFVLRAGDPQNVIPNPDALGEDPFDTNPRILAVAFGLPGGGGYRLALQDHELIPRRTVPTVEDPLAERGGVAIEDGMLRVALGFFASAGAWEMSTTSFAFQHREDRFELAVFERETVHRGSGETQRLTIDYPAGRVQHASGRIDSDAETVSSAALPTGRPPVIEEIGDGLSFQPAL